MLHVYVVAMVAAAAVGLLVGFECRYRLRQQALRDRPALPAPDQPPARVPQVPWQRKAFHDEVERGMVAMSAFLRQDR